MKYLNLTTVHKEIISIDVTKFAVLSYIDESQVLLAYPQGEDPDDIDAYSLELTANEFIKAHCSQELHFHNQAVQKFVHAVKDITKEEQHD